MISLSSLPSIAPTVSYEHKNITRTSKPDGTVQSVIQCIQLFQESDYSGRIVIHTGLNREGKRVFNVELRQNLSSDELREG